MIAKYSENIVNIANNLRLQYHRDNFNQRETIKITLVYSRINKIYIMKNGKYKKYTPKPLSSSKPNLAQYIFR